MMYRELRMLLLTAALAVFIRGYLPAKQASDEISDISAVPSVWRKRVGQLVIVLIDALRADFVFDDVTTDEKNVPRPKISYLVELLEKKDCLGVVIRSNPPTVTLPRVKAMLTGSLPAYVDVINNLNSETLFEDSLLQQWDRAGSKIVMFGDETWSRISPVQFLREDPTSSFYVTDYTQVDENVTRHLNTELQKNDWDVMVLHYLGLDHIGHIQGPGSPLVPDKLEEMGSVIKQIHEQLNRKQFKDDLPPAIVVVGDHGMADGGGHGGSSDPEILVPFVLISQGIQEEKRREDGTDSVKSPRVQYLQVDVTPTLAYLTGIPIPRSSMGRIIDGSLSFLPPEHKLQVLEYNARQLSNLSLDTHGVELLHEASRLIMSKNLTSEDIRAIESLLRFSIQSYQENLVGNLTNYDLYILALSVLLVISSAGIQPGSVPNLSLPLIFLILSFHFLTCSVVESELCSLSPAAGFIIILSVLILPSIRHVYNSVRTIAFNGEFVPLCFLLLHSFSFLSSSFIEEEHQTLYFLSATLLLYSSINTEIKSKERGWRGQVLSAGIALGLHRLLRGFNQTGDKWRHLPDISDNLNLQPNLRFNLFVFSAVSILIFLNSSYSSLLLHSIIITCIILQKYYVSAELAKIVYLALFIKIVVQRRQSTLFYETLILLCCLLLEETNVICLFILLCYLNGVKPLMMHVRPATASVMSIFIIKSSFFILAIQTHFPQ